MARVTLFGVASVAFVLAANCEAAEGAAQPTDNEIASSLSARGFMYTEVRRDGDCTPDEQGGWKCTVTYVDPDSPVGVSVAPPSASAVKSGTPTAADMVKDHIDRVMAAQARSSNQPSAQHRPTSNRVLHFKRIDDGRWEVFVRPYGQ